MKLSDMETQNSPYTPPAISERGRSVMLGWLTYLFGSLATLSAFALGLLLVRKPDLEGFLMDSLPGHHMSDAFDHLNSSIPVFAVMMTISLTLLTAVTMKERYSLVVSLTAGPVIGVVAWWATENFQDPNWFHFVAINVIGMLVSCLVTSVLAMLPRRTTEPSVAPKPRSRAV